MRTPSAFRAWAASIFTANNSGAITGPQIAEGFAEVSDRIDSINGRLGGWSLIATNPMTPTAAYPASGSSFSQSFRVAHKATAAASQIRLVYANYANINNPGTYQENYNAMYVTGSLQKMGTSGVNDQTGYIQRTVFDNGKQGLHLMPGALAYSLPLGFGVTKNETFYTLNHRNLYLPAAPSSAPTLTPSASGGGLVGAATYYVCFTYVFTDGMESATSGATQTTIPAGGSAGSITITAPPANGAAVGYRCYIGARNDASGGLYARITDIVPLSANAVIGQEISAYANSFRRQGGQLYYVGGNGTAGGTNYDGLNTGEGLANGDYTTNMQTYFSPQANGNIYSPVAILGRTSTPQQTVAIIGTSIAAGTGDMGYVYASGGFITRALTNQMALCYNPATDPLYAYVRVPLGSSKIVDFANFLNTNQLNRSWLEISELATNVISDFGTNDLSSGLTTMKTVTLNLAAYYMSRGIKYYSCTIIPKTNSTDGWQTVANQTTQGTTIENTRTGFNAWLRDATASGFVAQANAQASTTGLADYMDICKYLEVNSSNVLTQDGGFWRIPTGVAEVTGTVSTASNYQWTVSNTFTANQYKGWNFVMTSGAAVGKQGCIFYNSSNIINVSTAIGATTANGDSFKLTLLTTVDGVHPSTQGHIWMAQPAQEKLSTLQY